MALGTDSRFSSMITLLSECIGDSDSNDVILQVIQRFYGNDLNQLIDNRHFIYNLFSKVINECLNKEEIPMSIDERRLSIRSKLLSQFVFSYREYQLNLLLVLCDMKINLGLSDGLFDNIIKILNSNRVISEDAFNHWFKAKQAFDKKMKVIQTCRRILEMSQEAREDHFYDSCS